MPIDFSTLGTGFDFNAGSETEAPPEPSSVIDFSDPISILTSKNWLDGSANQRQSSAAIAFTKHVDALEQDKTRTFRYGDEDVPMFRPDGNWSDSGKEHLERTRRAIDSAARMPNGGAGYDTYNRKFDVDDLVKGLLNKPKDKTADPFVNFEKVKEEVQAVAPEGKTVDFTYDSYVDKVNEGKPANSPTLLDKDNLRMQEAFDRRKELSKFDPKSMGDAYLKEVSGVTIFNPDKLIDIAGMNAAIDATKASEADKRMMKIEFREKVNAIDSTVITQASDAADNSFSLPLGVLRPLGKTAQYAGEDLLGMEGSDLNSRFIKHVQNKGDMYSFLEANSEELSQDQYGMADKFTNAFWNANRATGAGALWLIAKPFGGNDSITQYASDVARSNESAFEGMGDLEKYGFLGMEFTNKGMYDLAGQVGSIVATMGGGLVVKGGIKALAAFASTGLATAEAAGIAAAKSAGVAAGSVAAAEATGGFASKALISAGARVTASEVAMKEAAQRLAPFTFKNFGIKALTDPSAYIGGLQAAGMSFGQTYNQVLEATGDAEQAYAKANMQATADGLAAFVATSIFNRIAPGLEKGLTGVEGGLGGGIIKRLQFNRALKETANKDAQQAAIKVFGELAEPNSAMGKALATSLREVVNRSARAAGLKGYGPLMGSFAEGTEEFTDEMLSDIFYAMQDDAVTWKGSVWDNIEKKFSQYMSAGFMGAIAGGGMNVGSEFAETAGLIRKKNRDERKAEIQQYAQVIWKGIKNEGEQISESVRDTAVKSGVNETRVNLAAYMADESIPLATRAKVVAEHALNESKGFARSLESLSATPVASDSTAPLVERKKSSAKAGADQQLMQDLLGDPPEGTEWNSEAKPVFGDSQNIKASSGNFSIKPVETNRGEVIGAQITDKNGNTRNVNNAEAISMLEASNKSKSRDALLASLKAFGETERKNYSKPIATPEAKPLGPTAQRLSDENVSDADLIKMAQSSPVFGDENGVREKNAAKELLTSRNIDFSLPKEFPAATDTAEKNKNSQKVILKPKDEVTFLWKGKVIDGVIARMEGDHTAFIITSLQQDPLKVRVKESNIKVIESPAVTDAAELFPTESVGPKMDGKTYSIKNVILPSVTTVKGNSSDFSFDAQEVSLKQAKGDKEKAAFIRKKWDEDSDFGTRLHDEVSKVLKGGTSDDQNVNAIVAFIKEQSGDSLIYSEFVIWNNSVAGTVDILFKNKRGNYTLIDLKTMNENPFDTKKGNQGYSPAESYIKFKAEGYRLQLFAYSEILKEKGIIVDEFKIIPISRKTSKIFMNQMIDASPRQSTKEFYKEIYGNLPILLTESPAVTDAAELEKQEQQKLKDENDQKTSKEASRKKSSDEKGDDDAQVEVDADGNAKRQDDVLNQPVAGAKAPAAVTPGQAIGFKTIQQRTISNTPAFKELLASGVYVVVARSVVDARAANPSIPSDASVLAISVMDSSNAKTVAKSVEAFSQAKEKAAFEAQKVVGTLDASDEKAVAKSLQGTDLLKRYPDLPEAVARWFNRGGMQEVARRMEDIKLGVAKGLKESKYGPLQAGLMLSDINKLLESIAKTSAAAVNSSASAPSVEPVAKPQSPAITMPPPVRPPGPSIFQTKENPEKKIKREAYEAANKEVDAAFNAYMADSGNKKKKAEYERLKEILDIAFNEMIATPFKIPVDSPATVEEQVVEATEEVLSEEEKQEVADIFAEEDSDKTTPVETLEPTFPKWNKVVAERFTERMANWMVTGKEVNAKLVAAFKKVLKAMKASGTAILVIFAMNPQAKTEYSLNRYGKISDDPQLATGKALLPKQNVAQTQEEINRALSGTPVDSPFTFAPSNVTAIDLTDESGLEATLLTVSALEKPGEALSPENAVEILITKTKELLSNRTDIDAVTLPDDLAKDWLASGSNPVVTAAATLLNESESNSKSIKKMLVSLGIKQSPDTFPWCASFVSWALNQSGFSSTNLLARGFLNMGEKVNSPKYGDVAVLWNENPDTGGRNGYGGHAGIVLGESGNYVILLNGNRNDNVNISAFSKEKVLGYRRFNADAVASNTGKRRQKRSRKTLNAAPDTQPKANDPLFNNASLPTLFVNLSAMDKPDRFGGTWTTADGKKIYTPEPGKTLPIGINTVAEVEGDPDTLLVLEEIAEGGYVFREVNTKKFAELMNTKKGQALGKLGLRWNRNNLIKAGKSIEPILKQLLDPQASISYAAFDEMFEEVMQVVAPGSNPARINYTTLSGGQFFQTERITTEVDDESGANLSLVEKAKRDNPFDETLVRDSVGNPVVEIINNISNYVIKTSNDIPRQFIPVDQYVAPVSDQGPTTVKTEITRINIDRAAFIKNLRSVFDGYNPRRGDQYPAYNMFVANEVARQIAAFVDEEQTHFVALQTFRDGEMVEFFNLAMELGSDPEQKFVSDMFLRIAEQRLPGKDLARYSQNDKFLVASETMRALHQTLFTGQSTEDQTIASKRLLIALDSDYGDKGGKSPWKTLVELLKRYMDKVKRIAYVRFMTGKMDLKIQNMLRRMETAYAAANLKGDVDLIKQKGLEASIDRFLGSQKVTTKTLGKVAMRHTMVINQLRKIAELSNLSLDSLLVLDYQQGKIKLSDAQDANGLSVRSYIERYHKELDLDNLDTALADLNATGAVRMVQGDLLNAWNRLEWARSLTPNALKLLDGSIEEGNDAELTFKLEAMLVRKGPRFDNGSTWIRSLENKVNKLADMDRAQLSSINREVVQELVRMDLSKVDANIKSIKLAEELGFTLEKTDDNQIEWQNALASRANDLAYDIDSDGDPNYASEELLKARDILFPDSKPFRSNKKRRRVINNRIRAFRLAILSKDDFKSRSLEMQEQAEALEAKASAGRKRYGAIAQVQQDLVQARKLRAASLVDQGFVEGEMQAYDNYLKALEDYNNVNKRFVNSVIGKEGLNTKGFGTYFQSLAYDPILNNSLNEEEFEKAAKSLRFQTGNLSNLFPESQYKDLEPVLDPASPVGMGQAFGFNYETAARTLLLKGVVGLPRMHPSDLVNPQFQFKLDENLDPIRDDQGNLVLNPLWSDEKSFVLQPLPTSSDFQVQGIVASNAAYVGMFSQMQWQRVSSNVNAKNIGLYEGGYGFNVKEDYIEDLSENRYEEYTTFLPAFDLPNNLYGFENGPDQKSGVRSKSPVSIADIEAILGITKKLKMPDGTLSDRMVTKVVVEIDADYAPGSYAEHIQKLKVWVGKILESTDPTRVMKEIGGIQTLAGRMAPRVHARALEAMQYIEAQESAAFSLLNSTQTGKDLSSSWNNLFAGGNETHNLFDTSIRALQFDTRMVRQSINSFETHRKNILQELNRTERDAAMDYDEFFEDARMSRIDRVTMANFSFMLNYAGKSRLLRVDATYGIDMAEKLRRLNFSNEGDELFLDGETWVWSTVPMFERDKSGKVVYEDSFVEDNINGEYIKRLDDNGNAIPLFTQLTDGSTRRARRPKVVMDSNGEPRTERMQTHVEMNDRERIVYAIGNKDNAGRAPRSSEMGEQSNTREAVLQDRSTPESVRSKAQRSLVMQDMLRQRQNRALTEMAMEIGVKLDRRLPIGEAYSDSAISFLNDLVELEKEPAKRDAVVRKAIEGLFGTNDPDQVSALVEEFEASLVAGESMVEVEEEENYDVEEAVPSFEEVLPPRPRISDPLFITDAEQRAQSEWEAKKRAFDAAQEGQPKTRTVTKKRKVKRMVPAPAFSPAKFPMLPDERGQRALGRDIDPFELLSNLVEFKAKLEMDLIDSARVLGAKGKPLTYGDGMMVGAIRTLVGNALSSSKNDDIKPTFQAMASKMEEEGMGNLFEPAEYSGFEDADRFRTIALMLHSEQLGNNQVSLYQGNMFAQYNETGFVSSNEMVNLLAQNIPGILIYRASKKEVDKNQAYFGSTFLPGVGESPPVLYVAEGNNNDNNRSLVLQALTWWATKSEQAELIANEVLEASEKIHAALSPITHVERLTRSADGINRMVDKFLDDYSASLIIANATNEEAMEVAAEQVLRAELSELLRKHFTNMENIGALSRPDGQPMFGILTPAIRENNLFSRVGEFVPSTDILQSASFNSKGADVSQLKGPVPLQSAPFFVTDSLANPAIKRLQSALLLITDSLTNPAMKRLLDQFLFGDNQLNSADNLSDATLFRILQGLKQAGEFAKEEEQGYESDNALEKLKATASSEETEEVSDENEETNKETLETELSKAYERMAERSGDEEAPLETDPSEEEKAELVAVDPTPQGVLQFLRNLKHDKSRYGLMNERIEKVLEEFQQGTFNGDPNWSGEGLPASDALLFNLMTGIISLAKTNLSNVPAKAAIEGASGLMPMTGRQVLSTLAGKAAQPVVGQNMPKPPAFNFRTAIPGRGEAPTIGSWHTLLEGRINGVMTQTLHFKTNRYKAFSGGMLAAIPTIDKIVTIAANRSINDAHTRWEQTKIDFISYQKANADIHLTPELFMEIQKSLPQVAEYEIQVRKEVEAMLERRIKVGEKIEELRAKVQAVKDFLSTDLEPFNADTMSVFNHDQRSLIKNHIQKELDRLQRTRENPSSKIHGKDYKTFLNQVINATANNDKEETLTKKLVRRFTALEQNPTYPGNNSFRAMLNEMRLPQDVLLELAKTNRTLTTAQYNTVTNGQAQLERFEAVLYEMNRVERNPLKGGYFQRLAYATTSPSEAGTHIFIGKETNPLGKSASVRSSLVFFPDDNFENPMAISQQLLIKRDEWSKTVEKDYSFYIMKEAIHRTLANHAVHADEIYQSVKRQPTYFNNYNPAAIIQQATDMLAMQKMLAKERLAKFALDAKKMQPGSQLSPDSMAMIADPDINEIYSISNVVEIMNLNSEMEKLQIDPEGNKSAIDSIQNKIFDLTAKRRVSRYKVPENFRERRDVIGHLVNNGEWIMLGQIGAEQDLKNRFYSETERQPKNKNPRKRPSMRNVVLNSLPVSGMGGSARFSESRMGFDAAWRAEAWDHADFNTAGALEVPPGSTREQAAKLFAKHHLSMLEARINARPGQKAKKFKSPTPSNANDLKLDNAGEPDLSDAADQLRHYVESIVLAYDKLQPTVNEITGKAERGLKEEVEEFFKKISTKNVGLSDSAAQDVRLFQLFARVMAKVEGEASLNILLTGLSTKLNPAELQAMKFLHHHDARTRVRFRKSYLAQLEAQRLHGYLQRGFNSNSGREGWIKRKKRDKNEINEAMKGLGMDSMQQSIPFVMASLQGLLETRTDSVGNNFAIWADNFKRGVNDLVLYRTKQEKAIKGKLSGVKAFLNSEHVSIVRDEAMVKEINALLDPIIQGKRLDGWSDPNATKDSYATELINEAIAALKAKSLNPEIAQKYADLLNKKFKDITNAAELMITAMGQAEQNVENETEWDRFIHGKLSGEATFVSTVPLRYAYASDPNEEKDQLDEKPYEPDPLVNIRMQELSLLGGPGRNQKQEANRKQVIYRPISMNGVSAVSSLLDDAHYRINVTPAYTILRGMIGNVQEAGPNQAVIKDSSILAGLPAGEETNRMRVALANVAAELDNEVANDMQQGTTDTALAESLSFLSSMYIFRALFSFQQWWNQVAPSAVGFASKKLASGNWRDAMLALSISKGILISKSLRQGEVGFNELVKKFISEAAPFSAERTGEGMDPLRERQRRQTKYGVGGVKKWTGRGLRELENAQEAGLNLAIAMPERVLSRSIFITELLAELRWMKTNNLVETIPSSVADLIDPAQAWHKRLPQEAIEAAQTKVNDHMGIGDQAKKAFFFQGKTKSPTLNVLMKSITRFSNHQATTSSNMSAMLPSLWQAERFSPDTDEVGPDGKSMAGQLTPGGERVRKEAIENIVGTIVQNTMFHAMKLKVLIPIVSSFVYMLGGDDEDEAMGKAQEFSDKMFNRDGEDNLAVAGLKALTIGNPGQFFQDWKDPDAAASSAYSKLSADMISEVLPVIPVFGGALGYSFLSTAFKNNVTNSIVQEATAKLTGLDPAENKWDEDAVYVYEREVSGMQTAAGFTAPTSVIYDMISGTKLAFDAAETGDVTALELAIYLATEYGVPVTREARQTLKRPIQEAVWEND